MAFKLINKEVHKIPLPNDASLSGSGTPKIKTDYRSKKFRSSLKSRGDAASDEIIQNFSLKKDYDHYQATIKNFKNAERQYNSSCNSINRSGEKIGHFFVNLSKINKNLNKGTPQPTSKSRVSTNVSIHPIHTGSSTSKMSIRWNLSNYGKQEPPPSPSQAPTFEKKRSKGERTYRAKSKLVKLKSIIEGKHFRNSYTSCITKNSTPSNLLPLNSMPKTFFKKNGSNRMKNKKIEMIRGGGRKGIIDR